MPYLRHFSIRDASVLLLVLVLFTGFCTLGVWQLQRRAWKLDLIAQVEQQLASPPIAAPGPADWPKIGPDDAYRPIKVSGRFLHDRETLVQAMTTQGSGYWVVTPLQATRGFTVLINRGFVPPDRRRPAARSTALPTEVVEVTGLLRLSEPNGRFPRSNDPQADRWYARDIAAIGAVRELPASELAPYFIDADRRPNPGGWPMGGLTVVQFRNTHLAYAFTWFTLALMTVAGGWIALRHSRGGLSQANK